MSGSGYGGVFRLEILDQRPGLIVFRAVGVDALSTFKNEPGGHRWQRRPPNDKHGRIHSSTITVAVLPEPTPAQIRLLDKDVDITFTRGSGPGGQNKNKLETVAVVTHRPTGLTVRCETERSQHQNRELALALLRARLYAAEQERLAGERAGTRRAQVGSGERSDKRRTVRTDGVTDHLTGKCWDLKRYLRGEW